MPGSCRRHPSPHDNQDRPHPTGFPTGQAARLCYSVPTLRRPVTPQVASTQGNMLLTNHLRINCRFTPPQRKPSSTGKTSPVTTTKIRSHHSSTPARTGPSQESCRPLTQPSRHGIAHKFIPSIFSGAQFGRYVVTRFLADAYFHGHRPTVPIKPPNYNPLLRLLSRTPGSSLVAPHAYHSMPTSATHTRHIQSLMQFALVALQHLTAHPSPRIQYNTRCPGHTPLS